MTALSEALPVLEPDLQVSFHYRLLALEELYLRDALSRTVSAISIELLDRELAQYVSSERLSRVASFGLRGEVFFPVPCMIQSEPYLLGYYRLLLGFSQKEFYSKGPFGRFKCLEERGEIPDRVAQDIDRLCTSMVQSAEMLVAGIDDLSLALVRDLQILTLGPQLRGSRNTALGQDATQEVFELIRGIAGSYAVKTTGRTIKVVNDSHRIVLIEFFSDPDVRIVEQLASTTRPIVSVEIKGGSDRSNIHNRLGEAEKSHQKAKNKGFLEFWTILRARVDLVTARRESPTTSHFFDLDKIKDSSTQEHKQFRELLGSLLGIRV